MANRGANAHGGRARPAERHAGQTDPGRCAADFLVNDLDGDGYLETNGEDMRSGYPNWATKYFLDVLLAQERPGGCRE